MRRHIVMKRREGLNDTEMEGEAGESDEWMAAEGRVGRRKRE